MEPRAEDDHRRVREVALLFLKLGAIGFGGPAAHVSLMQEEIVRRRKWIDRQGFLDLLGIVNLIPGPNSTELALHLGAARAGWRGFFAAGLAFILPAFLSVLVLSWVYLRFGSRPEIDWVLDGVKPVVIALVIRASGDLGRIAIKGPITFAAGTMTLALALWGMNPVYLLFAVASAATVASAARGFPAAVLALVAGGVSTSAAAVTPFGLTALFFLFLKVGAVVFGSGYALLAFLRADLVVANGWITDGELLDAIAIGQMTPGPVFTTATFIGYLLAGFPGAIVATAGIFLPSFLIVAATIPVLPRLLTSRLARAFLDGANVASLSLMIVVTLQLAQKALVDPVSMTIGAAALLALWFTRIGPAWLVLGGAAAGALTGALF